MNFSFSLSDAAGLSRNLYGERGVMYLDIENRESSTGTLFMADEPPSPVAVMANFSAGLNYIECDAEALPNGIEAGMIATGSSGLPPGVYATGRIVAVTGTYQIYLSAPVTENSEGNVRVTFTAPALTQVNGTTLQPGQRREFTAEQGNAFLDRMIRFYAIAGSQCDVVIRRGKR